MEVLMTIGIWYMRVPELVVNFQLLKISVAVSRFPCHAVTEYTCGYRIQAQWPNTRVIWNGMHIVRYTDYTFCD